MREIGGYIELDRYTLPMLHEGAIALNCARNALAYLIKARKIKRILIPKFLCDSVREVCKRENVEYQYYSIGADFMPKDIELDDGQWLYAVNFYGQLDNEILKGLADKHGRIIIDNVQAYYQMPIAGIDTIYTCRKFFGVADGAFLYTDAMLEEELPQDESFERMRFLLGRFERTASEFYAEYAANNALFANEPIKIMSKLTKNLLHAIDYDTIKKCRKENFEFLHNALGGINRLRLNVPEGAFMYPLYIENGAQIRKQLQEKKIYIPTLWPDVFECCDKSELEYDMAKNILPLPCDQRYATEEMKYLASEVTNV
ncbi:MAG: hypothetical protein IJO29_03840 [Oscillospiraceae bacterium]|nr:hypothetical protein [Oscillospiraceae bacterium]